jgi:hypothetical protein
MSIVRIDSPLFLPRHAKTLQRSVGTRNDKIVLARDFHWSSNRDFPARPDIKL